MSGDRADQYRVHIKQHGTLDWRWLITYHDGGESLPVDWDRALTRNGAERAAEKCLRQQLAPPTDDYSMLDEPGGEFLSSRRAQNRAEVAP